MTKVRWNQQDGNLFSGFYESELYNSDTIYNVNMNNDDEDAPGLDFVEGGFEQFQIEVCKKCVNNLMNLMEDADAIEDIAFIELNSPQYYNFSTDKLVCEVECDMDKIRTYCYETARDAFNTYLKDNYTSCDGFISFIENSVEKFQQKEDTDVLLDFYILNHLPSGMGETGPERLRNHNACDALETLYEFIGPVDENSQN